MPDEFGYDVNARDLNGLTPLHQAAISNDPERAELLLNRGADVNVQDSDGKTPLQIAEEHNSPDHA